MGLMVTCVVITDLLAPANHLDLKILLSNEFLKSDIQPLLIVTHIYLTRVCGFRSFGFLMKCYDRLPTVVLEQCHFEQTCTVVP